MRSIMDAFEHGVRDLGFKYRRHGYEFYIGNGEKFLFVVVFFPQWGQVTIFLTRYGETLISRIMSLLRRAAREIQLKFDIRKLY
ncbi:MAG: hypothetical protein ACTSXJ_03190 [Candidatus Baldrarchaeia archaeon]